MRASNVIRRLIQACYDDARTLFRERKQVDARTRELLTRFAHERLRFAEDLAVLAEINPARGMGSWSALARELVDDIHVHAARVSATAAVTVCRRSERRTQQRYDRVLHRRWPSALEVALVTQRNRVRDSLRQLDEMCVPRGGVESTSKASAH